MKSKTATSTYFQSLSGLIPATLISRDGPRVNLRLTRTRYGYKAGDEVSCFRHHFVRRAGARAVVTVADGV